MRRPYVSLQRHTLIASLVVSVSAACLPAARAQAVVTYGVSVGRAAGAGAAAGTGAAGIFDKLNKTTADAADHKATDKPDVNANPEPLRKPASRNTITIGRNKSAEAEQQPGTVQTASGISIAGLAAPKPANAAIDNPAPEAHNVSASAPATQPSSPSPEPEGFRLPEVPLPDPAPVVSATQPRREAPAARPEAPPAVRNDVEAPPVDPAKPVPASTKAAARVISDGITPKVAAEPAAPTSDANTSTIVPGTPIQDVIKLLGEPLMRLSGVEGSDHDERYVFLTASGLKLTILAHAGLVLKVLVE